MLREGLRQIGGNRPCPFVTEVTGDAAVDHAELGVPDLADPPTKSARSLDLSMLLEDLAEALLDWRPVGALLMPEGAGDEGEKDERERNQPSEVLRLERSPVGLRHSAASQSPSKRLRTSDALHLMSST